MQKLFGLKIGRNSVAIVYWIGAIRIEPTQKNAQFLALCPGAKKNDVIYSF